MACLIEIPYNEEQEIAVDCAVMEVGSASNHVSLF